MALENEISISDSADAGMANLSHPQPLRKVLTAEPGNVGNSISDSWNQESDKQKKC